MSGSKRTARERTNPAPRQKKPIFRDGQGRLRTGWLLACSVCAFIAVSAGVRLGLSFALSRLFEAWNVSAETASRAPRLARTFYAWHGSLISLTAAAAALWLSGFLRHRWGCPREDWIARSPRRLPLGVCAGIAASLAAMALCLAPDSSRLMWPLSKPRLSWALPVLCGFSFASVLAEEAFGKRVLYDGLRGRWGEAGATAVAAAFTFVVGRGYAGNLACAINLALLGVLGCLLYARHGLWASAGFRWGWSAANAFLFGFGGGDGAVYRIYAVSETAMTGGDAGPVYGLWTALLLSAGIAALLLRRPDREACAKA